MHSSNDNVVSAEAISFWKELLKKQSALWSKRIVSILKKIWNTIFWSEHDCGSCSGHASIKAAHNCSTPVEHVVKFTRKRT